MKNTLPISSYLNPNLNSNWNLNLNLNLNLNSSLAIFIRPLDCQKPRMKKVAWVKVSLAELSDNSRLLLGRLQRFTGCLHFRAIVCGSRSIWTIIRYYDGHLTSILACCFAFSSLNLHSVERSNDEKINPIALNAALSLSSSAGSSRSAFGSFENRGLWRLSALRLQTWAAARRLKTEVWRLKSEVLLSRLGFRSSDETQFCPKASAVITEASIGIISSPLIAFISSPAMSEDAKMRQCDSPTNSPVFFLELNLAKKRRDSDWLWERGCRRKRRSRRRNRITD